MRNEYLKKQIKEYHNDGEYNIDIANICGISERTVYRYLKEIREENSSKITKRTYIMSPHNHIWRTFCNILCVRLDIHPCDARTLKQSKFVLREFFPEIDLGNSLKYFRDHGGYCDCEVLMNVDGK